MSLSTLIGPIDQSAAIFLSVAAITICIITTTMIIKRRSRRDIANEHELAKLKEANSQRLAEMRLANVHDTETRNIETNALLERERIGKGMITSHATTRKPERYEE